jgi:hypothetical protein
VHELTGKLGVWSKPPEFGWSGGKQRKARAAVEEDIFRGIDLEHPGLI